MDELCEIKKNQIKKYQIKIIINESNSMINLNVNVNSKNIQVNNNNKVTTTQQSNSNNNKHQVISSYNLSLRAIAKLILSFSKSEE